MEVTGLQHAGFNKRGRFYDFKLRNHQKEVEKLKYMHGNPAVRALVARPDLEQLPILFFPRGGAGSDKDWTRRKDKIQLRAV
jgi:hypothetical protein